MLRNTQLWSSILAFGSTQHRCAQLKMNYSRRKSDNTCRGSQMYLPPLLTNLPLTHHCHKRCVSASCSGSWAASAGEQEAVLMLPWAGWRWE